MKRNWRIRLTAMTDAGSGSSHRCQIIGGSSTTMLNSDNNLCQDIRVTEMDGRRSIGSVWKWRYGGRITFVCFLVPLFSSTLLWITARYKWRRHRFLPPSKSFNWRWIFPGRHIPWKVAIELNHLVVFLMGSYDCIRRMIVSFFVPFPSFLLYWLWQPRGSALNKRDIVTARLYVTRPWPRNGHSI